MIKENAGYTCIRDTGTLMHCDAQVCLQALQMALDEWQRSRELPLRRSLDLACGSGEAFERRLGRSCHRWSFENIAEGIMEQDNAACKTTRWTETGCTGQHNFPLRGSPRNLSIVLAACGCLIF